SQIDVDPLEAVEYSGETGVEPRDARSEGVGLALDRADPEANLGQIVRRYRESGGGTADVLEHAIDGSKKERQRDEQRCRAHDRQERKDNEVAHRDPPGSVAHDGHPGHRSACALSAAVPAMTPFAQLRIEPATWSVVSSSAIRMVLFATC